MTSKESSQEKCKAGHTILAQKCRQCRKLSSQWTAYLKDSGFEDIENDKEEIIEKRTDNFSQLAGAQSAYTYNSQISYYSWARHKANEGRLTSPREQLIWESYAEGAPTKLIGLNVGLERSWVTRTIHKIESFLKLHTVSSGVSQMDLFFWSDADHPF